MELKKNKIIATKTEKTALPGQPIFRIKWSSVACDRPQKEKILYLLYSAVGALTNWIASNILFQQCANNFKCMFRI